MGIRRKTAQSVRARTPGEAGVAQLLGTPSARSARTRETCQRSRRGTCPLSRGAAPPICSSEVPNGRRSPTCLRRAIAFVPVRYTRLLEEVNEGYTQGYSDSLDVVQTDISRALFNVPDEGSVEPACMGDILLAPT